MKPRNFLIIAALLVTGLAGTAQATHFDSELVPFADCQGWSVEGAVFFGSAEFATVTYTIVLSQDGAEVQSFNDTLQVDSEGVYSVVDFMVAGEWQDELCGDYTVDGVFDLTAQYGGDHQTFSLGFTCDCPGGDCFLTPGFWKNHPEDWPVTEVTMGGITYAQDEAIEILCTPVRGDATIILAHHLIAAKLNVLAGADNTIQDAIDAGDEFLAEHGYGSRPSGAAKQEAIAIKNELASYNEQGCDDEDENEQDRFEVELKSFDDAVQRTWSAVKETYR